MFTCTSLTCLVSYPVLMHIRGQAKRVLASYLWGTTLQSHKYLIPRCLNTSLDSSHKSTLSRLPFTLAGFSAPRPLWVCLPLHFLVPRLWLLLQSPSRMSKAGSGRRWNIPGDEQSWEKLQMSCWELTRPSQLIEQSQCLCPLCALLDPPTLPVPAAPSSDGRALPWSSLDDLVASRRMAGAAGLSWQLWCSRPPSCLTPSSTRLLPAWSTAAPSTHIWVSFQDFQTRRLCHDASLGCCAG